MLTVSRWLSLTVALKSCQSPKFMLISFFSSSMLHCVNTRPLTLAWKPEKTFQCHVTFLSWMSRSHTHLPDGGAVVSHHALVDAVDLPHALTHGLRGHGAEEHDRSGGRHRGRALYRDTAV